MAARQEKRSAAWRHVHLLLLLLTSALPAVAQSTTPRPGGGVADDADPPAPVAPHSITRGDNGRVVVRAIRLSQPLKVDGRLDDAVYAENEPVGGFLQATPANGQPATEKTEAWVMFDDQFIYITGKCYDSAPEERWVANEMRRDNNNVIRPFPSRSAIGQRRVSINPSNSSSTRLRRICSRSTAFCS